MSNRQFPKIAANDLPPSGGFTLIEVTVAILIIIIGISGLFGLINQTFSYTSSNSMNLQAAYLGKEGIEIVKNIRDSNFLNIQNGGNWDDGLNYCDAPAGGCQADYKSVVMSHYTGDFLRWGGGGGGNYWNYAAGTPGPFQRKITITSGPDVGELNVKVEVFWNERNRPHDLIVQENIYRWWP